MKNNKLEFFIEIYVEEIPARFVNELSTSLKINFETELKNNEIPYEKIFNFGTPRRLTILITGLDTKTSDKKIELWGPPANISIDEHGKYLKPGISFINKNSLNKKNIAIKEKNGSSFIYGTKVQKGQLNEKSLRKISEISIQKIKNKKFMKWANKSFSFVRPISNIYANFNKKFIKIDIKDLDSKNMICGHRFSGKFKKNIKSFKEYESFLNSSGVILDFNKRKEVIQKEILKYEKKYNFFVNPDKSLLDEVANLTEFPKVLLGNFNKDFLKIPKEVINSIMKNHQKYFSIFKSKTMKRLLPNFIYIAGSSYIDKKIVTAGNEKVLAARLNDGKFFYEDDKNTSLIKIRDKINDITFIQGIGSYGAKSNRIQEVAIYLNKYLEMNIDINQIKIASNLCKADLASSMVYEFPELQGTMGKYYYENINKDVSIALKDHYLPKTRNDELPSTNLSIIISIADKLDTICSAFYLNLIPTGSSDPYGLRRCCIGIIRIVESLDKNLDLNEILKYTFLNVGKDVKEYKNEESFDKIVSFFNERIKNYFLEDRFNVNILNSILSDNNSLNIYSIKNKAISISSLAKSKDLDEAAEIFKRLKNITKNNNDSDIDQNKFINNYEKDLYKEIVRIDNFYTDNPNLTDSKECLIEIIKSSSVLSNFFEHVMVMDNDSIIRKNRLNLLTRFRKLISRFANLTEL